MRSFIIEKRELVPKIWFALLVNKSAGVEHLPDLGRGSLQRVQFARITFCNGSFDSKGIEVLAVQASQLIQSLRREIGIIAMLVGLGSDDEPVNYLIVAKRNSSI